ncbi:hypothetical protein [Piscinibacter sp.]|uniref:hypothetical protein n=1 Tax=Piscinibacter sp. TaxID=1903157 RepID=UPI002CFADF2F|nr:hypothetical protein [Albitalea sp.]HUG24244.1 hypothetical protein [Albitalea sp.]
MSDYFGALMRSSGLAVGGAAPIVAPRVEAGMPVEVHVEQPAVRAEPAMSPAPRAAHSAESPEPAVRALPAQVARDVHDEPAQRPDRPREPEAAPTSAQTSAPMEAAAVAHPSIDAAAQPASQAPVTAHTLVRTAMQWVAAGPQEVRAKPPAVIDPPIATTPPEPAPRSPDEIRDQRPPARAESLELPPSHEHPPSPPRLAPPPIPARPLIPQPATLRAERPSPASPRDDTVEVSIGAIHVRVDAPATQTVARTPPPPPAPRAASAPRPERSALSRRALRRI